MMSPTVMLARAWGLKPHGGDAVECGLCGSREPSRLADDVLKSGFTNRDELRSLYVCWACEACLNDRRSRSSLIVDAAGYRRLARSEVWPLLLDPPKPLFLLYLTTSGKKHGLFRQVVAVSRDTFWLQCEDRAALFSPRTCAPWMRNAGELVAVGVSREGVETGRYRQTDYDLVGVRHLVEKDAVLRAVRGRTLWDIVVGLMPSREHLKETTWATSA